MYGKMIGKFVAIVLFTLVTYSSPAFAAEPYPGYTFFASGSRAYLYDIDKEKVHEWKASGGSVQTLAYLLPDKMRVGNILTVSNGNDEVVEIDPLTNTKVKSIKYNFGSNQGGVQRLPNGNTLVTKGYSKSVEELDDDGNVVWSLSAPVTVHRAYRYGKSYPGVSELNQTAVIGKTFHKKNRSLRIIPNHHTGQIHLAFTNNGPQACVRIFTLKGRKVFSEVTTQSDMCIYTGRFTDGVYYVQVESRTERVQTILKLIR